MAAAQKSRAAAKPRRDNPEPWGVRPEDRDESAAMHYSAQEAERYTAAGENSRIQADMTVRAWQLLGLANGPVRTVADFGCGSGLSTAALLELAGKHTIVIGLDAAHDMLHLAARHPSLSSSTSSLCLADFREGVPLRQGCLDAAISISALQWLFAGRLGGQTACRRFFQALAASMNVVGTASFQLYLRDSKDAETLLGACRQAGLVAMWIVDFPHTTPAKKYFLCLRKSSMDSGPGLKRKLPANLPGHLGDLDSINAMLCPLGWPHQSTCTLAWARWLAAQPDLDALKLALACNRLRTEHARHAQHALRVLRRAAVERNATTGSTQQVHVTQLCFAGEGLEPLVPCGAPLHTWVSCHHWAAKDEGDTVPVEVRAVVEESWKQVIIDGLNQHMCCSPVRDDRSHILCEADNKTKPCQLYIPDLFSAEGNTTSNNTWLGLEPLGSPLEKSLDKTFWVGQLHCQKQAPLFIVARAHTSTGSRAWSRDATAHISAVAAACRQTEAAVVGIDVQVVVDSNGDESNIIGYSALMVHCRDCDVLEHAAPRWLDSYFQTYDACT